jgi:hypothetical protein
MKLTVPQGLRRRQLDGVGQEIERNAGALRNQADARRGAAASELLDDPCPI